MFLVLSARRYDFKNDSGERVAGATVHYLDLDGGPTNEEGRRGYEPLTITATKEAFESFTELPGVYDLDFRQKPGKNGRPTLVLTAVKMLQPINLTPKKAS